MWCLLMPEDEEQEAPGDAPDSGEKNQAVNPLTVIVENAG